MSQTPFPGTGGLAPNLMPNPPGEIPAPLEAGDATGQSPFVEPLSIADIIKNLVLDRPLKLYIPNKELYPDWEFRIINSIPAEIADAHNKGFKQITDPKLAELFVDLVAGTDQKGHAYRPMLFARPKVVGEHIRKRNRKKLQGLYAGMDPANKEFNSKYARKVDENAGTFGNFTGANWRIRV